MFTNDPKFRDCDVTTPRRKKIRSNVDALLIKYDVESFQVFWLGDKSSYVPESLELLEYYGSMMQVPQNSVIFHDSGNAFFRDGHSEVPQIFGARTAIYPPIVHQYLSPNDNRFHGTAKEK